MIGTRLSLFDKPILAYFLRICKGLAEWKANFVVMHREREIRGKKLFKMKRK